MKRVVYLFVLALIIGMVLVNLRTMRMQSVYELTCMVEEEQVLRQKIWQQQMRLSGALESPQRIKDRINELNVDVVPPSHEQEEQKP